MKKLINLAFALLISAASFAQGFNVQVCVNITGPPPNAPIFATLTYYANGSTYTMTDTVFTFLWPTTLCFPVYIQSPDSGNYAFANGYVQLSSCVPTQIYNYSQLISGNTTITVNAQNCNSANNCTAVLTQIQGSTLLGATGTGVAPFIYSWDGGITFTANAQYVMTGTGTYCVTIQDANGCTASDCFTNSGGSSCAAIIDIQGAGPYNLGAFGTGVAPLTYSWSTGDISQTITASVSGNYCLTVADANGCVDSTCVYLFVGNCNVGIMEDVDSVGTSYLIAILDPISSPNPTYQWQFNGTSITGATSSYYFPNAPGQYCLTVNYGGICTASNCYSFNPGNPIGGCSVYTVAIADSSNNNSFTLYAYPTGTPPFLYSWLFSDGTVSASINPSIQLNNNSGINWSSLTITDANGCVSSYCELLNITPPTGNCYSGFNTYSNYQFGNAGEVFFQSYTQNSGSTNVNYSWDFGDGNTSTLQNPSHIYSATGYYYVCLTTTYNGCTYTLCNNEYVDLTWWNNNPFQGTCTAGFMILTNSVNSAGLINIINTSQGNNLFYTWSFGNGFISNNPLPFTTINNPGVYEICVTILDTVVNCSDTFCDTITIDSLGNVFRSNMSGNVGILISRAPQPNALLTTVDFKDVVEQITIVPNPSNGIFNINTNWLQGISQVDVFDITGKQIKSYSINTSKGQKSVALDIQDVADGSYLVRVVSNQRVQTVKLTVSH